MNKTQGTAVLTILKHKEGKWQVSVQAITVRGRDSSYIAQNPVR